MFRWAKEERASESKSISTCRFKKPDGSRCQRKVAAGVQLCWQHAHGLKRKLRSLTKNQELGFVLGVLSLLVTVCALFGSSVMAVLPGGPSVKAIVMGTRVHRGNAEGCVEYLVSIGVPRPFDRLNLRIQFPMNVAGYAVGTYSEYSGRLHGAVAAEIGKTAEGECYIRQSTVVQVPEITGTHAGPGIMRVDGSNIPATTNVVGVFVMSIRERDFPPTNLSEEGSYEYKRLGYTVSKPLTFMDKGITEAW